MVNTPTVASLYQVKSTEEGKKPFRMNATYSECLSIYIGLDTTCLAFIRPKIILGKQGWKNVKLHQGLFAYRANALTTVLRWSSHPQWRRHGVSPTCLHLLATHTTLVGSQSLALPMIGCGQGPRWLWVARKYKQVREMSCLRRCDCKHADKHINDREGVYRTGSSTCFGCILSKRVHGGSLADV